MDLFGASHRWGGEQIKIYINHVTQPLSSAKIGTFSIFAYSLDSVLNGS